MRGVRVTVAARPPRNPDARQVVIAGAGHGVPYTYAAEVAAELTREPGSL